jgi:hypothetical protein
MRSDDGRPRRLMSILDHLTEIRCPNCDVHLFRALGRRRSSVLLRMPRRLSLQRGNQTARRSYRKLCHPPERR